jgi:hypothetical protein
MPPPASRRALLVRATVVLLGLVLAAAVVELGLRIGRHRSPRLGALLYEPTFRTEYDDAGSTAELLARGTLGYKPLGHTPGFVLNSRGFRTDEYAATRPPGVFRVVVLGDSFTFDSYGVPIEQMWHQVLERELAARSGRTVEVLSLSAPAVGPRFELRLWELEGRRLEPDLVVLAFFVGNDFTDEAGIPLEVGLESFLPRHSLAYRLVRNLVRLRGIESHPPPEVASARDGDGRGGYELPSYASTYDPTVPTFDEETFDRVERNRLLAMAGPDVERFDARFGDAAAVLERLARDVEATGAAFAVMIIPDQAQTDAGLRRRVRAQLSVPRGALDVDRPQRRLREYLASRRLPHLDLLPVFRPSAGRGLYKRRDTHWSAAGNRLAGETLADFVMARGLGPEPAAAQPSAGSRR